MDEAPTEALIEAIRNLHSCEATWVEAVAVKETFQGKAVWEGTVQVFELHGHPTATRAYAWSHVTTRDKRRFVAVLHQGPVDSPLAAVKAAIIQGHLGRDN
jgi:hypothetical protein